MTKRECAIVSAYTGYAMLCGDDFHIFHKYVEDIMGEPIFTHELATRAEEIKQAAKPDFIKLCKTATQGQVADFPVSGGEEVTDSKEEIVFKLINEVEQRKDIYLSIFIGCSGVSISVFPLEKDEEPLA